MFRFHKTYFLLASSLFLIEVLIAIFVHDNFFRPYFGDFLVVVLIYCSIKSFIKSDSTSTAIAVLLFSYLIEVLQYLNFIKWIGLTNSGLTGIVLGTSFSWYDIIAYSLGIITIWGMEKALKLKIKA